LARCYLTTKDFDGPRLRAVFPESCAFSAGALVPDTAGSHTCHRLSDTFLARHAGLTIREGEALAIVPAVSSAQSGPYVGGGLGYFSVDTGDFDGSDTSWKLFGGYRMNPYFATELEYIDGGQPDDSGLEIDISGFNLSVLGSWPVSEQFDVFAKLGMLFWDADARGFGDESGEDFSYGVGADFKFGENWAIRGEYQRFEIEDTDTADLFSLGVFFRF
jgi:OOP family OmpA-OmpF porin